ncbi:MAG: T9SS type A sorting domain-containing protein [Saprospiraceae bacterium]|nr:T9SS type A sorting domain-containing protein [Saprospiraceae bacterium]
MLHKKHIFASFLVVLSVSFLFSQSPLDLTGDVDLTSCTNCTYFAPHGFFSSETHVVNAFNFARRAEETQLSLTTNSLGTLTLPSGYSSWSATTRALYILNAERTARAGVSYSGAPVLGLPLEGLESHLNTIAQNHTQDMMTNNFFAHISPTTSLSPYQRIDNSATYGSAGACRDFMSYAENLYVSCTSNTSTPTYTVEQAMFSWIYRDAISSWGHRRAALIQNSNSYGATGFNNNVNSSSSEGHLGIGIGTRVYGGTAYPACGGTFNAHIVTMNIADPKPTCLANYNVVVPIELISFTGQYQQSYVALKWTTASERDNAYFIVERSSDGKNFKPFSRVQGAGTTQQKTNYTLDDITPLKGMNYYRLLQVDFDGKQSYSSVIAVATDKKTVFSVYPNPTNGIVNVVNQSDSETQIEVLNSLGEIVLKTDTAMSTTLNLTHLSAGIYVIRTSNGDIQRIVKY